MRVLVIFLVMLLFLPLASAAQLTFVGDESLKELPGSGTPGDPYLLGNLFINATNDTAILIKNTSAFLLIKNVSIVGENKRPGIILENVKNVRIENIRIVRCSYGIKIISSENITIANSTFKGNLYCYWKSKFAGDADCKGGAIFADYSRNLHIINNSFVPHSYLFSNIYGVYLIMVKNSTIYGNRFVSSVKCFPSAAFGGYCKGAAVYLDRSSGNEIIRNTIYLPSSGGMEYAAEVYGLYIWGQKNRIFLNDFYGLEAFTSEDEAKRGVGFLYVHISPFVKMEQSSEAPAVFNSPKVIYRFGNETFEGFLGNYWDSYSGSDENGDGVIEQPFKVDKYPLIFPSENYEIVGPVKEGLNTTTSSTWSSLVLNTSSPSAPSPQEEENLTYVSLLVAIGLVLIILWRRK